jgi:1,4-dihydroxy-2-naphthoate polyprenyltransferase
MKTILAQNRKMWTFVVLTRPVFLLGGFLLYGLGSLLAHKAGVSIQVDRYLLGQVMVTAIQLTAQYANEYHDYECDRLNLANRTWFTGGSGMLPSGAVSLDAAKQALRISAVIAILAILFVSLQAPLVGLIGLLSLLGAWIYSAPPVSLMGSGWGELVASIIVAFLVPIAGFVVQVGSLDPTLLLVCVHLVLVHLVMLIGFELPDWEADQAVGKRTLRVRLGFRKSVYLHTGLLIAAYSFLLVLHFQEVQAAGWVSLTLPLAIFQGFQVARSQHLPASRFHRITLGAVALFVVTVIFWWIGFLI